MAIGNKFHPFFGAISRGFAIAAIAITIGQVNTALAQDDSETLEEVVVTGSRLIRDQNLVSVSPITTVTADAIESSGNITLENTLNKYPQLNPDNTGTSNWSAGDGILAPDLRGLGSVRTLLLVDGRRYIPTSVTGLSDLATIPDLLIDRVEILTGGASAVYGSDAMAGAVNFILDDDFEGIKLRYQYGQTGKSDGTNNKVDLILGGNIEDGRGNVTVHASYTDRDTILMGNRWFSRQPVVPDAQGEMQNFGIGNIPGTLISIPLQDLSMIQGIDLTNSDGACPVPIQGVRFGENSTPAPYCRPRDQYNWAANDFLQRPFERWQVSALGRYDLSDAVEFYTQIFYTNKENAWQQGPYSTSPTFPGEETGTLLLPNADTNPVFPVPLRQFFGDNANYFDPDNDGIFTVKSTSRTFSEFGYRNHSILQTSFNVTTGLRGEFQFTDNQWYWDAFYQFQNTDLDETSYNFLSQSHMANGLDVVIDGGGNAVCRRNVLGCVPINLFGLGALSDDMVNYLKVDTGRADSFERQVAGASIAGDLFDLPSGSVSTAFGIEYRDEAFSTHPDAIAASGDLGGVPPVANSGELDLFEIFAEARIPIFESLALEGAYRTSDYSTIGKVNTWRLGVDWAPVDWGRLRASQSRAIRAPNLNELFAVLQQGYQPGTDPCVFDQNPSDAVKQLCLAQGVPAAVVDNLQPGSVRGWTTYSGGNPDLVEEEGDTFTAGFVITPIDGLSLSVDYFQIELDTAITEVSSQALVEICFDSLDINSSACQEIKRNSLGNIESVNSPLVNVATREVSGFDLQAQYAMELPGIFSLPGRGANLDISLISTWQTDDLHIFLPGQPKVQCAGKLGPTCSSNTVRATPGFRGLLSGTWSSGPTSIKAEVEMIGEMTAAEGAVLNNNIPVDPYQYWNLYGQYSISSHIEIFAGVNNLLDEQPPLIGLTYGGNTNTHVQLYDPLGRRYFLGTTVRFGE